ncbi:MAG: hypothetical protein ABFD50_21745 [Smithella sp.]
MNNDNISFMKWGAITRHHPSVFLLAAQLMSLALYVAFESVPSGQFLLGAFGMMILPFLSGSSSAALLLIGSHG